MHSRGPRPTPWAPGLSAPGRGVGPGTPARSGPQGPPEATDPEPGGGPCSPYDPSPEPQLWDPEGCPRSTRVAPRGRGPPVDEGPAPADRGGRAGVAGPPGSLSDRPQARQGRLARGPPSVEAGAAPGPDPSLEVYAEGASAQTF